MLILLTELAVASWLIGSMWAATPDRIRDLNRWSWVGDAHRIGIVKAAETSGRYPYGMWQASPFTLPILPTIVRGHVHRADPTYTAMAVVLLPYWLIVLVLVVLAVLSVRRAGVVVPRTWLRSIERRRGFEPIMTSKVPETRRDEDGNQPGEMR